MSPLHSNPLGWYDVHGLALHVVPDEPSLLEPVHRILGPFTTAVQSAPPDAFELRLVHHSALQDPQPLLPCLWRGRLPGGSPGCYRADGSRRQIELTDRAVASVDLASRQARITLLSDDSRWITFGCLTPLLTEMLRPVGWHVVHGALLRCGQAPSARAVLLCGASGMGKTTAALALSRGGLRLLADDALFVRNVPGGASVWGLARPCKVQQNTRQLLSWLDKLPSEPTTAAQEDAIALAHLGDVAPQVILPAVILFLEQRNAVSHRLRSLQKIEALTHLTRQNVRQLDGPAAFAAMTALANCCGGYGLSVGPELATLEAAILALPELKDALAR
jgi:hypothetical protein